MNDLFHLLVSFTVGPDLVSGRERPHAFSAEPSSADPADPVKPADPATSADPGATQGRALRALRALRMPHCILTLAALALASVPAPASTLPATSTAQPPAQPQLQLQPQPQPQPQTHPQPQPASRLAATMLTPWAADARAGRGWQEYPRPQMTRDAWQNLNGLWDYAITPAGSPAPQTYDGRIRVPYCVESALSGVTRELRPDQRLWYHRAFTLPETWAGRRVLLHFGAVDWETIVFVNGAPAGSHRGGYTPFTLDITPCLKPGVAQHLVVAVTDPTSEGNQPRGKQHLRHGPFPVSGIWQTVWLEPVPAAMSIAAITCEPDLDAKHIKLTTTGSRVTPDITHYAIRARVFDAGKPVAEITGLLNRELTIPIPAPVAWSPASPHLYDLQVDLYRAADSYAQTKTAKNKKTAAPPATPGQTAGIVEIPAGAKHIDGVKSYFAMRKISLGEGPKGAVVMLNNKPLFQFGPLDQGIWPDGIYTPPTEAAMRHELDFLKKAGFNMLRKHAKTEPALYYAYCDKIGLLVWQDMPPGFVENTGETSGKRKKNPDDAAQFERELRDMIDALRAFPCIVTWVIFNEGWGQFDSARISKAVKASDPTRLVNEATGGIDTGGGDFKDIHDYREDMRPTKAMRKDTARAFVLGEFGGVGYPIENHLWWPGADNKRNRGYQTYYTAGDFEKHYRNRLDQMRIFADRLGLSAGVYTETTDVLGEVNGLLTYDRRVAKLPAEKLAEIHKTLNLY